jgi:hypothetical protein
MICRHKELDKKLLEAITQGTELKKWPLPGIPTLDSTWARLPALLAALDLPPLAMETQQVTRHSVQCIAMYTFLMIFL